MKTKINFLNNKYNRVPTTKLVWNESVENYVFQLRKLAKNCKFPDNDGQIKEKLIINTNN